jgi:hypothetical protein
VVLRKKLTVLLAIGILLLAMEAPAFGAANGHASCQGAGHSNQTEPGAAGDYHKQLKSENGDTAKRFARAGERGQDKTNIGVVGPNAQICIGL